MKTLKEAKIGDTVYVMKLHGEGAVKRRIMDMGILKMTNSVFLMLMLKISAYPMTVRISVF